MLGAKQIQRFDYFKKKVSKNNTKACFVLKADIKHYFETVDHCVLLSIINRKITDKRVLWLVKIILGNHNTKEKGKGMPLGNLTSQFFANVYLNELDKFVKHKLRAKYYTRYVDDFVILHSLKETLDSYKQKINKFLSRELSLELHPDKSRVLRLDGGICFLGVRIFFYHKLLTKKNLRKFQQKLQILYLQYNECLVDYDTIYEFLEGWMAYAKNADTFKLRKRLAKEIEESFPNEISTKEINFYRKLFISAINY